MINHTFQFILLFFSRMFLPLEKILFYKYNLNYQQELAYQSLLNENSKPDMVSGLLYTIRRKIPPFIDTLLVLILDFLSGSMMSCKDYYFFSSFIPGNLFNSLETFLITLIYKKNKLNQKNIYTKVLKLCLLALNVYCIPFMSDSLILNYAILFFLKKQSINNVETANIHNVTPFWFMNIYMFPEYIYYINVILFITYIYLSSLYSLCDLKGFRTKMLLFSLFNQGLFCGTTYKNYLMIALTMKNLPFFDNWMNLLSIFGYIDSFLSYKFRLTDSINLNFVNWAQLLFFIIFLLGFKYYIVVIDKKKW
ncbi:hypothetical protein EDEG_01728 [Edhazardia aedis USNM 41457]|uniref:Microsporidial 8TM transmembrane domain-containing protein n=1 Tax=Edhazardia aedis (strain USNM 41457) TaxID=1003232 RepID=J9D849_EDHAE|nr:hypothetical protein EDEG_01728 [Edhazardia aedis USNM 41457]|eukprot:EJW03961.1 hypothetical protein EDEG_01728 [Edhazardia aedis USNM 41457]